MYVYSGGISGATLGIILGVLIAVFVSVVLVVAIIVTIMILSRRMGVADASKSAEAQRSEFGSTQTSPEQSPKRTKVDVNGLPEDSTQL